MDTPLIFCPVSPVIVVIHTFVYVPSQSFALHCVIAISDNLAFIVYTMLLCIFYLF